LLMRSWPPRSVPNHLFTPFQIDWCIFIYIWMYLDNRTIHIKTKLCQLNFWTEVHHCASTLHHHVMRAPWEASTQATKLHIRLQQQTSKSEKKTQISWY
jgi:hypothetical protein